MRLTATSILFATALAGAHAQELKEIARIAIPGNPVNQFGAMAIDQASGLGYFVERDNRGLDIFDAKTNQFVKRITGLGGNNAKGQLAGPNGVIVVNNGAEVWASDGDSTVKVIDVAKGEIVATLATGGRERANGMSHDPVNGTLIVANSNDEPPYLNVISTRGNRAVITKTPVPDSAENIERSVFQAATSTFWSAIPVFTRDTTKGLLAQTDSKSGKLIKLHELEGCHPHSLQLVSPTRIFLGCSSGHGASPKPGGDLAVFDITTGAIVSRGPGLGGNGSSDINPTLSRYYHATTNGSLLVLDTTTGALVQKLVTPTGARSLAVHQSSGRVYLATPARDGPCGGCILVFAPQ